MNTTEFLKGISHELKFWKGFVKTERFLNGWVSYNKTPELNQMVYEFIQQNTTTNSKVLDVGSGVVSILNGTVPPSVLTAADPLGGLYECIFDYEKYHLKPCVAVPAEEMDWLNEFDIVHMSNAIDHSQCPGDVLENLYRACKRGGFIILQGFEKEGSFEKWEGFHQWDFVLEDDQLSVTMQNGAGFILETDGKTIVSEKIHFENKTWYVWIIQK